MIRVVLHGHLKDLCPDEYVFSVQTAKEAIEALSSQCPQLDRGERHRVRVLGFDTPESFLMKLDVQELQIVPQYAGAKDAWLQIGLGVLLVGLSFALGNPFAASAAWATSFSFTLGATFILGGLSQLLAPAPTTDADFDADPEASNIIPAAQNTTKIGTPIPLGFGRHKLYGQILSLNIDSSDLVTLPTTGVGVHQFASP